jgi:hypothetical protein
LEVGEAQISEIFWWGSCKGGSSTLERKREGGSSSGLIGVVAFKWTNKFLGDSIYTLFKLLSN